MMEVRMGKTDAQLARTELELHAIDAAIGEMRYLGYSPHYGDTWKRHCEAFNSKLADAIRRGEFWQANPDYKFG